MIRQAYAALGIEPARYRLSLPGPGGKYTGDPASWERAAAMLAAVLDDAGLAWEEGPGEAAFYGPKIDVQVADSAEREATLSTVQVDFYQPEQFGLRYAGAGRRRAPPGHGAPQRPGQHGASGRAPAGTARRRLSRLARARAGRGAAGHRRARPGRGRGGPGRRPASGCGLASPGRNPAPWAAASGPRRLVPYQAVIGDSEAAAGQVAIRLRDGRRLPPRPRPWRWRASRPTSPRAAPPCGTAAASGEVGVADGLEVGDAGVVADGAGEADAGVAAVVLERREHVVEPGAFGDPPPDPRPGGAGQLGQDSRRARRRDGRWSAGAGACSAPAARCGSASRPPGRRRLRGFVPAGNSTAAR